ncbi:MAG: RlmE family RNA methyltransferase [Magnetococcus sp. DMHC-6]
MTKLRPSSARWLREHAQDPYVQAARAEGYRSRAAYKLLEIHTTVSSWPGISGLLRPGMSVVDLGAAPGGWTQVAAKLVGQVGGKSGHVLALDLLPMVDFPTAYPGVEITLLLGDFLQDSGLAAVRQALAPHGFAHVLLSDMAPQMCGNKMVDQSRGEVLAEAAFLFANEVLLPGGSMVVKLFQGPCFHDLVRQAHQNFDRVRVIKPKASRPRSPEHYLVALGYKRSK